MLQFLKFDTEQAYEYAWQFLLGYLLQADLAGKGLSAAQLKRVLDQMQQFAAEKSPGYAPDMAELKNLLDRPVAPAADEPAKWPVATWEEVRAHQGPVHEFSTAESGRMLKAALQARWPRATFRLATNRYGTTEISYVETRGISFWDVRALAQEFEGRHFDGQLDSQVARYHWRPTPAGRQLVRHGIGGTSIKPTTRSGKSQPFKQFK